MAEPDAGAAAASTGRSPLADRVRAEMADFDDPTYASEFASVEHIEDNSVLVTDWARRVWYVQRDMNPLEPPVVLCNGRHAVPGSVLEQWSPALFSAPWLLMLMQVIHVE